MKSLHRPDLFSWSTFDRARNIDFNATLWVRDGGNIAFDPLPLSAHDAEHVAALGGIAVVVVTNSDHARDAAHLAEAHGAELVGPSAEADTFPIPCTRWLSDGESLVPGLVTVEMNGSKTPGELAFLLEETTLITGDLVRAHSGGRLMLLPPAKLSDPAAALRSLERLLTFEEIEAVLVGDGWPVFRDGHAHLAELHQARSQ